MTKTNDVKSLYLAADLFFLPSLFEGLPVTGVEAQAMGLPCIVSDSITKEMIYTDLVQFLNLSEKKELWADSISKKLDKEVDRASYKQDLLQSPFSSGNAGKILEKYYTNLLS